MSVIHFCLPISLKSVNCDITIMKRSGHLKRDLLDTARGRGEGISPIRGLPTVNAIMWISTGLCLYRIFKRRKYLCIRTHNKRKSVRLNSTKSFPTNKPNNILMEIIIILGRRWPREFIRWCCHCFGYVRPESGIFFTLFLFKRIFIWTRITPNSELLTNETLTIRVFR